MLVRAKVRTYGQKNTDHSNNLNRSRFCQGKFYLKGLFKIFILKSPQMKDLRRRGPGAPQEPACQPETMNLRAGWCLRIMRGCFSTAATAKKKTAATAKIKGILWEATGKAT